MYDARETKTTSNAIDLRSDTVTQPDEAMRQIMAEARVGDDVYGEDPSINALENFAADLTGKDAGLFLSSGTQSNFVAVLSHCQRGEQIIIGAPYHVNYYEAGGASVLGGIVLTPLPVEADGGLSVDGVRSAVRVDDPHFPISRLVSQENTHNGKVIALSRIEEICETARSHSLSNHLDGARFFNAVVALGIRPSDLAAPFDTISLCLSKGLGAPVGSVLVGRKDLIDKARRWRKMLGGGMRQAGILAAVGLHALQHNVERLEEDHKRAGDLATHLRDVDPTGDISQATNMIFYTPGTDPNGALHNHMDAQGITLGGSDQSMRIVLHKDINDKRLAQVKDGFSSYFLANQIRSA